MPFLNEATRGAPMVANSNSTVFWAYPGNAYSTPSGSLQYRSILTHGYVAGGYKDSTPWRTVNKTWHSTDITVSCGEQLQVGCAYAGGTFSDYNGYVHGPGAYAVAGARTLSYSLGTGVARTLGASLTGADPGGPFGYSGGNPVGDGQGVVYGAAGANAGKGSWELSVARSYFAGTQNQLGQVGYINGGPESAATDKFNFPTEIMYTTNAGYAGTHCTAAGGATMSWWSHAGGNRSLAFSNDTWAAWAPGTAAAPDGVCKMLSTKLGYHYVGSGSNVTIPMMKWSDSTGSTLSTAISKPTSVGEENMEMGQNWGYCLGAYTGLQANYSFKLNYTNDGMTVLGTGSQPKGHVGMSSGMCSSAAATVTMSMM